MKNFYLSVNYTTNFNPTNFKNFNKFNFLNKNKIFCKNFFLFIYLIKFYKKNFFFKKITVFIKPFKKNIYNILRAPYKNKMSRHQISFIRYNIKIAFVIDLTVLTFFNINSINIYCNKIKLFFIFIESNFIYKNKLIFLIKFRLGGGFFKIQ